MAEKRLLAVDIGAGSGRMMLGSFDGSKLTIAEKFRFTHEPVGWNGDVYWNFLSIWGAVQRGMRAVAGEGIAVDSVGFDSFAPDFGLFHRGSAVIPGFLSYRSVLGTDIRRAVLEKADERELFAKSGLQCTEVVLLPQLLHLIRTGRGWMLRDAELLPLVNALAYLLTGRRSMDFTVASISLLWNAAENRFDPELCGRYFERFDFMPPLEEAQAEIGSIPMGSAPESFRGARVISVGAHDTAVAMYALNCAAQGQLCMNCGTWTALGIVRERPVAGERAFQLGLTNYGLPDGRYFCGSVMLGLFYIQKCRAELEERGQALTYAQLSALAAGAAIYPLSIDDGLFQATEGPLLKKIDTYFERNGARGPRSAGEYARCLIEALTEKYRRVIEAIELAAGNAGPAIFMGGGGIYDAVLCGSLEKKTGKRVVPVAAEATALGNMASQLLASGEVYGNEIGEIIGGAVEA